MATNAFNDDDICKSKYYTAEQRAAAGCKETQDLTGDVIPNVLNVAFAIAGVLAVVLIIAGGISMTTSAGDPGKVKKAKDMIVGAIVGLVIVLLAYAIVNFVLGALF